MPKLVIFKGENVENETRLAGRPVRLGRDNRNDIVLDDKSVSRFHAEVRPEGDKYFIVDLKSRNGVWVNGQQVKGKTALALGAPVTLGAFEVTLEDDVPTGEFDEGSPLLEPRGTVVNPPTDRSQGHSPSTTRPSMKAAAAAKQRQVLWAAAAVAVLLILGVTFAVIRYRRPAATTVEVVTPPPVPATPTMPTVVPEGLPADDPTRATIDKHVEGARAAVGKNDYAAAREHVARVLELAPANQAALELKRQIEGASRTAKPPPIAVVTPPPPPPAEIETPGIPRRPGEVWPEYLIRVQRIDVNLKQGKSYAEKKEFLLALARFRLVSADQKGYQDVEALMTDTLAKQRQAVDEAVENGLRNEQQARWLDAMKWYQAAQAYDPNATNVRQRMAPLTERLTRMGIDVFGRAEVFRKRNDNAKAIPLYREAFEMLPRGHEKSLEAQKWLETLKP